MNGCITSCRRRAAVTGPFVLKRSLSFTFSNPVYLGPGQTTKTFDDAVLNNATSYAYEAFERTLTDTLYFYHADHLGTPIAMTNGAGTLVWRAEHTPFGGIYALTVGTITNNLRFPGQYYDGEIGLAQNYYRDYRSTIGRYWSPDQLFALDICHGVWPADLSPGQYTYVESSPINYIDPFGLWRWYGNWGGPNWTGGQKGTWDTIDRSKAKPPINKQDACYMDHDICYGGCSECKQCKPKARADCFRGCDRKLAKCLRDLGNDPSNNWKAKAAARYFGLVTRGQTHEKISVGSKHNKLSARYCALPSSLGDIMVGNHLTLPRRAGCAMAIGLDIILAVRPAFFTAGVFCGVNFPGLVFQCSFLSNE